MTARCFPLVGGRVMRVTRLDECGNPVYGPCSRVVSDGFVSIATTAVTTEGDTIDVKNANGKSCVRQQPPPTIDGFTVQVNFCRVDPDLFSLITGQTQVLDEDTGEAIGFRVNTAVEMDTFGWALEVWSNVPGQACAGGVANFGYVLYPFLSGGVFGDFTIENDAVTFSVANATTKSDGGWGEGPYKVQTVSAVAAPLSDPIGADDHLHVQLTTLTPPSPTCGCLPLDDPESPAPTQAVAGTPGTWTGGGNRPDDLAALRTSGITASPATAWTTGQYVILEDGTRARWDSDSWEVAP